MATSEINDPQTIESKDEETLQLERAKKLLKSYKAKKKDKYRRYIEKKIDIDKDKKWKRFRSHSIPYLLETIQLTVNKKFNGLFIPMDVINIILDCIGYYQLSYQSMFYFFYMPIILDYYFHEKELQNLSWQYSHYWSSKTAIDRGTENFSSMEKRIIKNCDNIEFEKQEWFILINQFYDYYSDVDHQYNSRINSKLVVSIAACLGQSPPTRLTSVVSDDQNINDNDKNENERKNKKGNSDTKESIKNTIASKDCQSNTIPTESEDETDGDEKEKKEEDFPYGTVEECLQLMCELNKKYLKIEQEEKNDDAESKLKSSANKPNDSKSGAKSKKAKENKKEKDGYRYEKLCKIIEKQIARPCRLVHKSD